MRFLCSRCLISQLALQDDDDFEVVPQDKDEVGIWEADGENEDENKQAYVLGI